jgi:hypothetical protein
MKLAHVAGLPRLSVFAALAAETAGRARDSIAAATAARVIPDTEPFPADRPKPERR